MGAGTTPELASRRAEATAEAVGVGATTASLALKAGWTGASKGRR